MYSQTKAAGTGIRAAGETTYCKANYTPDTLPLVVVNDVPRVDSRILAEQLGRKHKHTFELILKYKNELEQLNHLPFKTEYGNRSQGGGMAKRSAQLCENQSYFLLALSRNNPLIVQLKLKLVQAFSRARDGVKISKEYLPFYHQLQDEVKHLAEVAQAAGSKTSERMFHISMNRMVNSAMGLKPGERGNLTPSRRLAVSMANCIAREAIKTALNTGADHHEAYTEAKAQVQRYASGAALLLGV